jgi:hypothetical protein
MPIDFLLLSFLIILWWIGIWGFIETIAHQYIKGSPMRGIAVYTSIMLFVIVIVNVYPSVLNKLM